MSALTAGLLSLKLDPNSRDVNEWTALHCAPARIYGELTLVEVLVRNGASVHAKNYNGKTAFHLYAAWFVLSYQIIEYLFGRELKSTRMTTRETLRYIYVRIRKHGII